MKRLNMLLPVAVVVCIAACWAAGSAAASTGPTLLFLGSEGPTVLINNKPKEVVKSELQSSVSSIRDEELTVEGTLLQEHGKAAGTYHADFFKVAIGTETCHSEGDETGTVLVTGNVELVYTSTSPLEVGPLFEVSSLKIKCVKGTEETKITINGTILGSISPINSEIEKGSNTIEGGMVCKEVGTPVKTKYTNSKGEEKTAAITATVAGKEASACELVGTSTTSTIPVLPNKMVEIMG